MKTLIAAKRALLLDSGTFLPIFIHLFIGHGAYVKSEFFSDRTQIVLSIQPCIRFNVLNVYVSLTRATIIIVYRYTPFGKKSGTSHFCDSRFHTAALFWDSITLKCHFNRILFDVHSTHCCPSRRIQNQEFVL